MRIEIKKIKRLFYYRDLELLIKVFIASIKISFILAIQGVHSVIASIPPVNTNKIKNADRDKINRYVNLYLFILKRLGIRNTCLTYSILLCHMLRQFGINAKINFGAKKTDFKSRSGLNMIGHCWVSVDGIETEAPKYYKQLFSVPSEV